MKTHIKNSKRQSGNVALAAVLVIAASVGIYMTAQHKLGFNLRQTAEETEAYNAGLDANKNSISLAKALLEFPDGSLYQDPYYPVNVASITQMKANNSDGRWAYNRGQQTLTVKNKSYHLDTTAGKDLITTVTFQTPEEGRNWIKGENGPLLLSIDVVATTNSKVRVITGQKDTGRSQTVVTKATISMQRPPIPKCHHELSGASYGMPAFAGAAPMIMVAPYMFMPHDLHTITGTPVTSTVYCDGVVSYADVAALLVGQKQMLPKESYHHPYKADSVRSKNVMIGKVALPQWFAEGMKLTYKAVYASSDPVPAGTLPVPLASYALHASVEDNCTSACKSCSSTKAKSACDTCTSCVKKLTANKSATSKSSSNSNNSNNKANVNNLLNNAAAKLDLGGAAKKLGDAVGNKIKEGIKDAAGKLAGPLAAAILVPTALKMLTSSVGSQMPSAAMNMLKPPMGGGTQDPGNDSEGGKKPPGTMGTGGSVSNPTAAAAVAKEAISPAAPSTVFGNLY